MEIIYRLPAEADAYHEVHLCCRHRRHLHGRHIDLQEDADLAQAIDPGSLDQILGEGGCVLLKEEDQERGGDAGDDDSTGGVQTDGGKTQLVEVGEQLEQGNHQGCKGNHHRGKDEVEDSVSGLVSVNNKGIASGGGSFLHHGQALDLFHVRPQEGQVPVPHQGGQL